MPWGRLSHTAMKTSPPTRSPARAASRAVLCWTIRSEEEERRARAYADNVTFEDCPAAAGAPAFTIDVLAGMDDIAAADWDRCASDGRRADRSTFHDASFLLALPESGSVTARRLGSRHLVARDDTGRIVGVMPLYAKGHSQGEYVFDHNWAHAWKSAGGGIIQSFSRRPLHPRHGPPPADRRTRRTDPV